MGQNLHSFAQANGSMQQSEGYDFFAAYYDSLFSIQQV